MNTETKIRENFQILLRSIAAGHEYIYYSPSKNKYTSFQCDPNGPIVPKDAEKLTVLSQLQLELYGQSPSDLQELDFNNTIRGAFGNKLTTL